MVDQSHNVFDLMERQLNLIADLQSRVHSQERRLKEFSSRQSAMSDFMHFLIASLVQAHPERRNRVKKPLKDLLDRLEKMNSGDIDFDSALKSHLKMLLKYLQNPPENPHLCLVTPESDDEDA